MSKVYNAHRTVTTKGTYMGEEGEGYNWGELSEYGDFSERTRGHIQGYDEPCKIEVFDDRAELRESNGGGLLLYWPEQCSIPTEHGPLTLGPHWGLHAGEALSLGLAQVVEEARR
jgi:hypothetical protein